MEEGKNSVLVVDDDAANIATLVYILRADYNLYVAKSGQEAINLAKKYLPDVILLDILMPDIDGYEVISILKNTDETREIPVIFATGLDNDGDEEKGLALGAADYITKPFKPAIVKLRVQNQIQIVNHISIIRHFSVTDQLTSLSNRRNFDNRLQFEWDHAVRGKTVLGMLMIDIDDFKAYNDTYGHLQGDEALRAVAGTIRTSLRRTVDFAARWGGEEFAVLLPNTKAENAFVIAESVRKSVEETVILTPEGEATRVTVSIGVNAQIPTRENLVVDFIRGADKALYEAKKMSKNKVCM